MLELHHLAKQFAFDAKTFHHSTEHLRTRWGLERLFAQTSTPQKVIFVLISIFTVSLV